MGCLWQGCGGLSRQAAAASRSGLRLPIEAGLGMLALGLLTAGMWLHAVGLLLLAVGLWLLKTGLLLFVAGLQLLSAE